MGAPVIVWLNGPFGVGKTTAARRLCERLPDAVIADPEPLGWMLRRTIGRGRDYQDLRLWRRVTTRMIRRRARRHAVVVVVMSVLNPAHLDEMLGRAASHQEAEMDSLLGAMLSILEPALIVFMGVMVLLIVLAILLPIFQMNQLV